MNDLYVVGDVHGNYKELIFRIINRYDIKDSNILILGDFGIGFDKTMPDLYRWSEKKLEKNNIEIDVLRGNHDDPEYFDGDHDYPRLKFLKDHTEYDLANHKVYIIGGANSIDIDYIDEFGEKRHRIEGVDWWSKEDIIRKDKDLFPTKVDVIATHSAPLIFDPIITRSPLLSEQQYEKILSERRYLDVVLKEINADFWYYGHYHKTYSGSYGKLLYRCLPPLEFFLVPSKIIDNPQGKEENINEE